MIEIFKSVLILLLMVAGFGLIAVILFAELYVEVTGARMVAEEVGKWAQRKRRERTDARDAALTPTRRLLRPASASRSAEELVRPAAEDRAKEDLLLRHAGLEDSLPQGADSAAGKGEVQPAQVEVSD